ncbi:tetratricopeptide repeat protein [Pedobacter sp. ASV12]|uniref:tetratricopeptide repeat protein n=1 Tax=Pedobacter sp. ASV12 TaxID=2795120 RepID=UPI0018EDE57F|nr:hypothetical protein [Pedobacter sp. ASV12]
MKKLLLSTLLVGVATLANAQKSEVNESQKSWNLYVTMISSQGYAKSMDALNKGLAHTDLAIANEKSKVMPEAWSYRALLSSEISRLDTVDVNNALSKQKIAEEAIGKAKTLDTKGSEKDNIATAEINLINAKRNRGVRAYNNKDYAGAMTIFKELLAANPKDTAMYINVGVTANLTGKYQEAVDNFKKVVSLNVPESKDFYIQIINLQTDKLKDTTAALATIQEALAKFPNEANFIGAETDLYIAKGDIVKSQESLAKLIAKDPSKEVYHYLMGDTYYKQALAVQETRNKLDAKKTKEYDALSAKIVALIDQSIPFYKKALDINPKYVPALETLKQIYAFKNDTANWEAIKKRLDAIPAN